MQSPESLPVLDGKYQLTRQLGQGGMGAVYEATHLGTSRRVAVKVISTGDLAKKPELVDRFRREATVTGKIESQYIAQVTDAGLDAATGWPFMVMELLSGEDVEQAIARLGPLPPEVAIKIGAQACLGLQKAHESGVIHRDIKPANLYLTRRDGGEVVVKIVDFGIAKLKDDQGISSGNLKGLTQTGSLIGSPLYMSPEQAYGKKTTDHRSDIWSLGVVLYEALTGRTPHADSEAAGRSGMVRAFLFAACTTFGLGLAACGGATESVEGAPRGHTSHDAATPPDDGGKTPRPDTGGVDAGDGSALAAPFPCGGTMCKAGETCVSACTLSCAAIVCSPPTDGGACPPGYATDPECPDDGDSGATCRETCSPDLFCQVIPTDQEACEPQSDPRYCNEECG